MKIWIVNHYAIPPSQTGGTRHYSLARALIARGHDVTIVASNYTYMGGQLLATGGERVEVEGVPFLWLPTPPYETSGSVKRMWNNMMFARGLLGLEPGPGLPRPDVIVGSSPHLLAAWGAERLARRFDVPFVLEIRDVWPQSILDLGRIPPWHPVVLFFAQIEKHLYRRAVRIVSLLPAVEAHVVAKGGRPGSVTWLPNGIDLAMVPALAAPASGETFTLYYAGSHGVANDLDTLLDAAVVLRDDPRIAIHLIGGGPEKPRLMARARDEGLTRVHFEDPVPKAQIYARLAQADGFVLPVKGLALYQHGISPNKIYDYLALGRPTVIASNSANNPIADAGAGLTVAPGDPAALAAAIRQLADLAPAARATLGESGRRYVAEHHDVGRLAERLEAVLREAVEPPAGAQP
ncbi:MAG: hypothetical protein JWM80_6111 [Cyanobacteria bacterium RYN_339]|nr:hypothetical protein [Cyanobacteria bacterium RYN_339]